MTDLPTCLTGRVDVEDEGRIKLRADAGVAVIVIPEDKYIKWEQYFPPGLSKACESKYGDSRRLWFVMTDTHEEEARCSLTGQGVWVFWGGFSRPIDVGDWQPNPPETLPEVSYADIMWVCGYKEEEISTAPDTTPAPAPEPEPEPFDGLQIPQEMKNRNQWLCWKFGERDGRKTKIPINPETYKFAAAPEAAWSYETCRTAMAAGYRGFVGIGFSLRNGIAGVDLDKVLDANGRMKPEYAYLNEVIDTADSYTEISPSGEGLHIYFRCDDIPPECKAGRKKQGPVEMYCEGRFYTVTGKAWRNPGVLRTISAEEYREIHTLLFGGTTAPLKVCEVGTTAPTANTTTTPHTPRWHLSDEEVLSRAREKSEKIAAALDGDLTPWGDDHSRADMAVMTMFATITDCNSEQMRLLFLQTKLGEREKAQRPDYIDRTIKNAIKVAQEEATKYRRAGRWWGGNNWQAEEAFRRCTEVRGKLEDIKQAADGVYAIYDPIDGNTKLVVTGKEPEWQRWVNTHFADFGYDAKFAEEMFRNISVLHTADPIPEIDISKPITALPCLDGYISLKDGKQCERPAEMEYCPFVLHLTTQEAEYDQNYLPTGRVFDDLMAYVGKTTVSYLLSVTAASIPRIPANRRVVIFTGASRSFKTTFGMLISELGLSPPRNVDFSSEMDKKGKFRPELATYIPKYPMLFVNDPHDPDGTQVKKLCDETQQYERKHCNQSSIYQRATCVLTMNHPPDFRESAMEAKVFFVSSIRSFLGAEIQLNQYLADIHADGSLCDLWQAILRTGLKQNWQITIPQLAKEHNQRMIIGAAPIEKWLSLCIPYPYSGADRANHFVSIQETYENYMVFANPNDLPQDVLEIVAKKGRAATWTPRPDRDHLTGVSKNTLIRRLEAISIPVIRRDFARGFYMTLPPLNFIEGSMHAQAEREREEERESAMGSGWSQLFPGDDVQKLLN